MAESIRLEKENLSRRNTYKADAGDEEIKDDEGDHGINDISLRRRGSISRPYILGDDYRMEKLIDIAANS